MIRDVLSEQLRESNTHVRSMIPRSCIATFATVCNSKESARDRRKWDGVLGLSLTVIGI